MRVTNLILNISSPIPLGTQQRIKLVVLHIDNNLLGCILLVDELANGAHGFSWHPGDADRVHLPVVFA